LTAVVDYRARVGDGTAGFVIEATVFQSNGTGVVYGAIVGEVGSCSIVVIDGDGTGVVYGAGNV